MGHVCMPTITIYISLRSIVNYPITGYVVMNILSVVGYLVHHHRGMKQCPSERVNISSVHQNGALSHYGSSIAYYL